MVAHVSDFGLARIVSTIDGKFQSQTSISRIKGTIGYAPQGTFFLKKISFFF